MTNTTIFAIIALTSILLLGTSNVFAPDHDAPLFPSWFNNNLQWYLDGQVDEMTLANAFKYLADELVNGAIPTSDLVESTKQSGVRAFKDYNPNIFDYLALF